LIAWKNLIDNEDITDKKRCRRAIETYLDKLRENGVIAAGIVKMCMSIAPGILYYAVDKRLARYRKV